ncbi:MAG TPA: Asp23/Gls24 family envelope stress response protein [Atribacteraceae bacterium]|nr:Asp23/Gls24 family envelope stress response protein [Atribacteraceae bacterium]
MNDQIKSLSNGNSKDYESDNSEKMGEISIAPDIIATLTAITTMKVPGVTGMAGGVSSATLSNIMGKRELNKGVKVDIKEKVVTLDVSVVLDIDSSLIEVARNIQSEVKSVIESKTGMSVARIDINVREVSYREKEDVPDN